jgi:hypothetical protein
MFQLSWNWPTNSPTPMGNDPLRTSGSKNSPALKQPVRQRSRTRLLGGTRWRGYPFFKSSLNIAGFFYVCCSNLMCVAAANFCGVNMYESFCWSWIISVWLILVTMYLGVRNQGKNQGKLACVFVSDQNRDVIIDLPEWVLMSPNNSKLPTSLDN